LLCSFKGYEVIGSRRRREEEKKTLGLDMKLRLSGWVGSLRIEKDRI